MQRRRGMVACRRCRRLRIKCIHDPIHQLPCEACRVAGPYDAQACSFPRRGESDVDRKWRARIQSGSQTSMRGEEMANTQKPRDAITQQEPTSNESIVRDASSVSDEYYGNLPSAEEIIEACRVFTTSYFQLGFIPKTSFFERIHRYEVSDFLLLAILCLSARFTPCLIQRYGGSTKATERFMIAALERVPHELYNTNLENIQALFLLSIAEWGNGDRDRSSIHMGVAVRMAAMMKLHREETYQLPPDATNDQIIYAETARRTFWMIQSQDNLHSGYSSPLPFSCEDITALLPCGESDFSFGIRPAERAALPSTPPALANPSLVDSPRRSLFATLIQSHSLWGQVARRASRPDSATLGPTSEYMSMAATLKRFEENLPTQHKWSIWSVKVWKDLGFELAYLSVVMMIRLGNILLRRMYLENIKASISTPNDDNGPSEFWKPVSEELFHNVVELYQQIEVSFTMREQTEGYPAILVFPIYVCGSLALNLWQCPKLCPRLADKASAMLLRCLKVITDLQHAWPMARKWQEGLQQAATPLSAACSPADIIGATSTSIGDEEPPVSRTEVGSNDICKVANEWTETYVNGQSALERQSEIDASRLFDIHSLPTDLFEAEVTAFLQGDLHYGLLDKCNHGGFGFH